MPSIYCNDCGGEMNIEIDYGQNPIDDMINKLKLDQFFMSMKR